MKLEVRERVVGPHCVYGELWVDGQRESFTLEPHPTNPVHAGHPAVAAGGPYLVRLTPSPRLRMTTPEVFDVPGRSDIRIHIGNKPEDTLGCVLVGEQSSPEKLPDWIGNSKAAFDKLMTLLRFTSDEVTITFGPISLQ